MFLPVNAHANIDPIKINSIRQAIRQANIRSPPRPQRQVPHFTLSTYELLAKLREKSPDFIHSRKCN